MYLIYAQMYVVVLDVQYIVHDSCSLEISDGCEGFLYFVHAGFYHSTHVRTDTVARGMGPARRYPPDSMLPDPSFAAL